MVFPIFQVLGKSDNSNRFWTPRQVLLRNFLHFLPSFCLHISKTMESDIFSFMWNTDKIVKFLSGLLHCKYIQCNFHTFSTCPNLHCNPTVLFTFNCCSKQLQVQWTKCNTDLQRFTVTSTLFPHCKNIDCRKHNFFFASSQ